MNVREFIRLTPLQKERLMKNDPEQYKKLLDEMKRCFPKDTDQQALQDLSKVK